MNYKDLTSNKPPAVGDWTNTYLLNAYKRSGSLKITIAHVHEQQPHRIEQIDNTSMSAIAGSISLPHNRITLTSPPGGLVPVISDGLALHLCDKLKEIFRVSRVEFRLKPYIRVSAERMSPSYVQYHVEVPNIHKTAMWLGCRELEDLGINTMEAQKVFLYG